MTRGIGLNLAGLNFLGKLLANRAKLAGASFRGTAISNGETARECPRLPSPTR